MEMGFANCILEGQRLCAPILSYLHAKQKEKSPPLFFFLVSSLTATAEYTKSSPSFMFILLPLCYTFDLKMALSLLTSFLLSAVLQHKATHRDAR